MTERFSEEIKRRTRVVIIFHNKEICLRLVWDLAINIHKSLLNANCYLNIELLREHKKEAMRTAT
jgi:putative transposase